MNMKKIYVIALPWVIMCLLTVLEYLKTSILSLTMNVSYYWILFLYLLIGLLVGIDVNALLKEDSKFKKYMILYYLVCCLGLFAISYTKLLTGIPYFYYSITDHINIILVIIGILMMIIMNKHINEWYAFFIVIKHDKPWHWS